MNTPNTKTNRQTIFEYIKDNYEVAPIEIITKTGISQQTVHNNLKKLLDEGLIAKKGTGLDVVYYVVFETINKTLGNLTNELNEDVSLVSKYEKLRDKIKNKLATQQNIIDQTKYNPIEQNYTYISPEGKIYNGLCALSIWSQKQKINQTHEEFLKLQNEYLDTLAKYNGYKNKNGLIDATDKFRATFPQYGELSGVFYCDFYSIERFGKTKLGNYMFYGKQSQNKQLIQETCYSVKPLILDFIKQNNINAVAFVPPTISRDLQFMNELTKYLDLNIPIIKLKKVVEQVAVQQKSIKNAGDRIINAQNIVVEMNPSYENVLILDDVVESGSTFAVVAHKLKLRKVAISKIFALAIVGSANGVVDNSPKGFEIVNEV